MYFTHLLPSLMHLILEYKAACWDPYREGQTACKTKWLNLHITEKIQIGEPWHSAERGFAYVFYSQHSWENGLGRL
jgi:hypothetical protein